MVPPADESTSVSALKLESRTKTPACVTSRVKSAFISIPFVALTSKLWNVEALLSKVTFLLAPVTLKTTLVIFALLAAVTPSTNISPVAVLKLKVRVVILCNSWPLILILLLVWPNPIEPFVARVTETEPVWESADK